jgi:triosephosphate isomerase
MHHDHLEAIRFIQDLALRLTKEDVSSVDVSVHPPFTDLRSVQTVVEDRQIPVALGAQNCHSQDRGAFTGEVSAPMLARLGVVYVIVGHSERRQLFGETDNEVAAKLRAVLASAMTPILCVGETEVERQSGMTEERLAHQATAALSGLDGAAVGDLVVAYEPIWAIGTGQTATAEDAQEACAHLRRVIEEIAGAEPARSVHIQYGGSVNAENTADLVAQPDVDGVLVGGASLDAGSFAAIVGAAAKEAAASRTPRRAASRPGGVPPR